MKKLLKITLAAWICSTLTLSADSNPFSGRIQHSGMPGSSETALAHVGERIPQSEVRVGPSSQAGVGLAFLIAVEVPSDEARNTLMMAEKVEFVVNVKGVDSYNGAPPSALQVVFLASGITANEWANYAAWNKAAQYEVIGLIESDPAAGEYRFDITKILAQAPQTSSDQSLIYFAIHSPAKDLTAANAGQHVFIEASQGLEPRIEVAQ